MKQAGWRLLVKKTIDRSAAIVGIAVTAPVMCAVAIAVRASMGSPVLFRQKRPGLHGKIFEVLKFRTMKVAVDASGRSLPDDERLTSVGRFLRATSLDELPQLYNVIRGDISLVGPRPLLVEYLSRYTAEELRRHDVLPGITGLAAVRGRNGLDWDERLRLDVQYVDEWSLWLDAKILAKTAVTVLRREGISAEGHVTSPELRPGTTTAPDPAGWASNR